MVRVASGAGVCIGVETTVDGWIGAGEGVGGSAYAVGV